MEHINKAPFTEEEVIALNKYQNLGFVHEFTCPNDNNECQDRKLVATTEGFKCVCGKYLQNWVNISCIEFGKRF